MINCHSGYFAVCAQASISKQKIFLETPAYTRRSKKVAPLRGNIHARSASRHTFQFDTSASDFNDSDGRGYSDGDSPESFPHVRLLERFWLHQRISSQRRHKHGCHCNTPRRDHFAAGCCCHVRALRVTLLKTHPTVSFVACFRTTEQDCRKELWRVFKVFCFIASLTLCSAGLRVALTGHCLC